MKMSLSGQMRLEQRMKLAPRMIQSMEVLQLPLLALQEKIDAELSSNPVLELAEETDENENHEEETLETETIEQKELVVNEESDNAEDFQRLDEIGESFGDYFEQTAPFKSTRPTGSDKKLEALQNTAADQISLHDYLLNQWGLVEADENIKDAGIVIIDFIDEKGYLTVRLEQLYNKDKHSFSFEQLEKALDRVQNLEPAGIGARDVRECMLIQISQLPKDMTFETEIVTNHWQELLENHLPKIAKKMRCSTDDVYKAIEQLSKLDRSPGLQIGKTENYNITADVTLEENEEGPGYIVSLTDAFIPNLRVNNFYSQMSKDRKVDAKTREFLQQNIHSAQWLMDAIAQRKQTLLRVATAVVEYQKEFFSKGKLHLKPLPMATIADKVGVHIATVSRAVAGKYIQCSQGMLPLRGFFTGGTESNDGSTQSWDAVKAKLQTIVNEEDKSKPLNDDQICEKLMAQGVKKIARRTVAKYRKLMDIPAGRFRKKY
ncbi:MAG: RNA polymerase factor sigma-54 [Planctomycetes bacterium]|nr:RNA polymerase factor sigma-54 [Planctomycetota bacterium]